MKFLLECSTRCLVEHEKRNFISPSNHVLLCLLYKQKSVTLFISESILLYNINVMNNKQKAKDVEDQYQTKKKKTANEDLMQQQQDAFLVCFLSQVFLAAFFRFECRSCVKKCLFFYN